MKPIPIGTTADGVDVSIDVKKLLVSKAFVCANSGGGKSYLLRKLAEGTIPLVQTIILDPEGEYATLREKFDLLLVGADGEVPADPRTAATLTKKIADLGISAVIDLSDLELAQRRSFVRTFCETLVNLPRAQWLSRLVIIDEAHMFVPEQGNDQAESGKAVIDMLVRGRKRGIGAVLASQRLSKVHKDAEAELNTIFVGRTSQDLDQQRAAKLLGITPKAAVGLRDRTPGEFHLFGPAIRGVAGVGLMRVGDVATTHPTPGSKHMPAPPKASEAVKKLVAGLAEELPKLAEEEARTMAEAKKQIADLQRQLKAAGKPPAPAAPRAVEVTSKRDQQTIRQLRKGLEDAMKVIAQVNASGFEKTSIDPEQIRKAVDAATGQIVKIVEAEMTRKGAEFDKLKREANKALIALQKLLSEDTAVAVNVKQSEPFVVARQTTPAAATPVQLDEGVAALEPIGKTSKERILHSLAQWKASRILNPNRLQVAIVAGYTVNGHLNNVIGELKAEGSLDYPGNGSIALTPAGEATLTLDTPALDRERMVRYLLNVIKGDAKKKMLRIVAAAGGPMAREELATACGYTINGHFNNLVGELSSTGALSYPKKGQIGMNPQLFEGMGE